MLKPSSKNLFAAKKKKEWVFCARNTWTSKQLTQVAITTVLYLSLVIADSLTLDFRGGETFSCHLIM